MKQFFKKALPICVSYRDGSVLRAFSFAVWLVVRGDIAYVHVFSHSRHLGVWHSLPLHMAVLRHWHFQQVFVALLNSSIQLLGPLLCFGMRGRLKWVWRVSHSAAVPGNGFHVGLSSSSLCFFFMSHILFDISVVICARCSGPLTCARRFGRRLWSVLLTCCVIYCHSKVFYGPSY